MSTAFGGDLCALGGWTVTIDGSRKFGGYLAIVYTFVGGGRFVRRSLSIPLREHRLPRRTEANRGGRQGPTLTPRSRWIVGFGATAGCTCRDEIGIVGDRYGTDSQS